VAWSLHLEVESNNNMILFLMNELFREIRFANNLHITSYKKIIQQACPLKKKTFHCHKQHSKKTKKGIILYMGLLLLLCVGVTLEIIS